MAETLATAPKPRGTSRAKAVKPAPVATGESGAGGRERPAVSEEAIRVRAYYLALEHHGRGDSREFWLQAERELRAAAELER